MDVEGTPSSDFNDTQKEGKMRVNREKLLNELESVRPGLSPKEIIEQSSCFVFQEGSVMTYNDEVACRRKCSLEITGAVQAEPLLQMLQKLPNDEVDVEMGEGEFRLKAGRRSTGIRMEQQILLPIGAVEKPQGWKPLDPEFAEAVDIVSRCASKDQSQFSLTCVHIHQKWVEACDNYQLSRFPIKNPVDQACLVRVESLRHIVDLQMSKFSETDAWIHFRNKSGLRLSCRRSLETYPDFGKFLEVKGTPTTLPKGLGEAVDKAEVFSKENADNNQVIVELSPNNGGRLTVVGEGVSGWYREVKKLKYRGTSFKFRIDPKLLIEITDRHNDCEISEKHLIVNGARFKYCTCLGKASE